MAVLRNQRAQYWHQLRGGYIINLHYLRNNVVGPPIFGAVVDYTGDFADGWITTAIFVALGAAMVALMVRERHRVAR